MKNQFICKICGLSHSIGDDADLDFESCGECGARGEWRREPVVIDSVEISPMLPEKFKSMNAMELFKSSTIEKVVNYVTNRAKEHIPDLTTAKGRKAIASNAAEVSRSKTFLEKIGKAKSAEIKADAKILDASRKYMKDTLDVLRDEMRKPLTDWEAAKAAKEAAEELAEQISVAHSEAIAENDLFNRQKEVKRKEAELAKIEEDRLDKEADEKAEKERLAREKQIRKEAEAKSKLEQEQAKKQAEADKKEAVEKAKREAKEEAERKERDRLAKEESDRKEAEKKAADKEHRAKVKSEATRFIKGVNGITQEQADAVFDAIANNEVPHVKVGF